MFASSKNQLLPIKVTTDKGKAVDATSIQLIIKKPKKGEAVIVEVKVKLK